MAESDGPVEFDCCECGIHVLRFDRALPQPPLCGECTFCPGWFRIPELRAILDPEGWATPPEDVKHV